MIKIFAKYITLIFIPVLLFCGQHSFASVKKNYSKRKNDSIRILFQQSIASAADDSLLKLTAYFEYGENLDLIGDEVAAIENLKIALRIAKNIDDHVKVASVANNLANAYSTVGDFIASNSAYITALESAEKIQNYGEIAKISMNLASNYNYTGDYEKAIKYGLYALKTKETNNNLERICYHYIAMGNIFRENNNTAKWEEYVLKAYKMKDVKGCANLSDRAKIYNSLGGICVQKEEFGKALLYYDTLLVFSQKEKYDQGISVALTNSAGVYKQQNNFSKALELSTAAEKYFGENPYDKIFNRNFKAELYNLTGQFKKGLTLVNQNIETDEINWYSTEKLKCLELLYELNFNLNNYDKAFFWNDSLRKTETILRDEDIRHSTEELETRYETEKKEQKIELLTAENEIKNQRMWLFIAATIVLLLLILFGIFIYFRKKKENLQRQEILKQQLLRSQMNPHFLFNALGSIQNFMLKNETKRAAGYLNNFASLTRNILEHSSQEFVSVTDEIETLRNYMELEKMRLDDNFEFEIKFDEELETDLINIPPMLIQPFVENAIKHGLKNIAYKGLLELKFEDKGTVLHIEISDNGIGIKNAELNKSKTHRSMSMNIFEQRRIVLAKRTKQAIGLEVIDLQTLNSRRTGTLVKIEIPISA